MAETTRDLFKDTERRNRFYKEVINDAKLTMDIVASLDSVLQELSSSCSDWPSTKCCPLILSLDEVHPLFVIRNKELYFSIFSRLKSTLSELVKHGLCTLCLSTVSSVAALAPSKAAAASLREKHESIILPTPFTELSFDVHIIDNPLASQKATLQDVGSFKFTAMFGRPMYALLMLIGSASHISLGFIRHTFPAWHGSETMLKSART